MNSKNYWHPRKKLAVSKTGPTFIYFIYFYLYICINFTLYSALFRLLVELFVFVCFQTKLVRGTATNQETWLFAKRCCMQLKVALPVVYLFTINNCCKNYIQIRNIYEIKIRIKLILPD